MKSALTFLIAGLGIANVHALVVNEVMSNPAGDDSGREWVELYNETDAPIDLTGMTVSIKGGSFISTTLVGGGNILPAGGYAIIGSTVSGATKFLQDYPAFTGPLLRSSISLVNTGATSIDIKVGTVTTGITSYVAAKENHTLSFIGGTYVTGIPTPGAQNAAAESDIENTSTTATTTATQVTLPQMSPPTADIVLYMPEEKVAVAGAESEFSVFALTRAGKNIDNLVYSWTFGDGGQAVGSSTKYRYAYTGRYVAYAEALNGSVYGTGRMSVRVVSPDISIAKVGTGKYGAYVDITNPNPYELNLSQWVLSIDGARFPFPKNTVLLPGNTTRFSGVAMGFASTTLSTSTLVRITFPNLEEVVRYSSMQEEGNTATTTVATIPKAAPRKVASNTPKPQVLGASSPSSTKQTSTSSKTKDTRIVAWFKRVFAD